LETILFPESFNHKFHRGTHQSHHFSYSANLIQSEILLSPASRFCKQNSPPMAVLPLWERYRYT